MHKRKLANIECLEINNDSDQWVVMLHGFGADAGDLYPLAEILDPQKNYNWLFPNGILSVSIGPGMQGRAWWPINLQEFAEAQSNSSHSRKLEETLINRKPEGMDVARNQVIQVIQLLDVPWNKIVLGGFSQGAMLATDLFLRAERNPKGLIIFSGSLISKEDWNELANQHEGCRFFQSHGKSDPILHYKFATQLNSLLNTNGLKGSLHLFEGGHEIPTDVLLKAREYLKK